MGPETAKSRVILLRLPARYDFNIETIYKCIRKGGQQTDNKEMEKKPLSFITPLERRPELQ